VQPRYLTVWWGPDLPTLEIPRLPGRRLRLPGRRTLAGIGLVAALLVGSGLAVTERSAAPMAGTTCTPTPPQGGDRA
jgi:hypothetical protein